MVEGALIPVHGEGVPEATERMGIILYICMLIVGVPQKRSDERPMRPHAIQERAAGSSVPRPWPLCPRCPDGFPMTRSIHFIICYCYCIFCFIISLSGI